MIKTKVLTSLEKVFPEGMQDSAEISSIFGLHGETVSFQIACFLDNMDRDYVHTELKGDPEIIEGALVRQVELVPCEYPRPLDADNGYLKKEPGLYPDLLRKISKFGFPLMPGQWRSLWITLTLPDRSGEYELQVILSTAENGTYTVSLPVMIVGESLPTIDVKHTEWFHGDCLADYYNVEVFSEEHWRIMENFLAVAAKRSCNMILTPIFTPPLDTAVGGERRTIQLIDVTKKDNTYFFGFEKLKRWVDMCQRCGFVYFEMSHLFTQWGAKAAPKIMGIADGKLTRLFGWDTQASGEEYADFLHQFLPELTGHFEEWGLQDKVYFHISDEPGLSCLEDYRKAREIVADKIKGYHMLDALSDYKFFQSGLVEQPVCSIDHLRPFLLHRPEKLWTYYCCGQRREVPNRFIAQHSGKNRILGVILYLYRLEGFLQWGFNFYNCQNSYYPINPYLNTDADGAFPSGDPFLVYPGEDGKPEESIRLMVLEEAFSDLRFLYLAEKHLGRERVEAIIRETAGEDVTFRKYPQAPTFFFNLRRNVMEKMGIKTENPFV